ncbi:hypothetical protein [Blastochloris viridis]|uniref:PilZ domain-containing protein n=1 Tax=Blastochloris viridis TaxID=1079 RepID=A0A0N7IUB0_BLAVI|nr:hypothetical protein [Blastochloris viridis]ALK08854.1 hypothetical protein BVIR_1065 [Blastochloris viridis]CUU41515.1 hypothetical protein BVIRIDIS_05080 [Blastochloris viridis]
MTEHRVFTRLRPSGRVSDKGKIFADVRSPTIECTVVDQSARGACLDIHGSLEIPKRFFFLHGGVKKSCVVLWQKGRRVGVSY